MHKKLQNMGDVVIDAIIVRHITRSNSVYTPNEMNSNKDDLIQK